MILMRIYRVETTVFPEDAQRKMNELARDGWRVVTMIHTELDHYVITFEKLSGM